MPERKNKNKQNYKNNAVDLKSSKTNVELIDVTCFNDVAKFGREGVGLGWNVDGFDLVR